jgi:hypothetical protein
MSHVYVYYIQESAMAGVPSKENERPRRARTLVVVLVQCSIQPLEVGGWMMAWESLGFFFPSHTASCPSPPSPVRQAHAPRAHRHPYKVPAMLVGLCVAVAVVWGGIGGRAGPHPIRGLIILPSQAPSTTP